MHPPLKSIILILLLFLLCLPVLSHAEITPLDASPPAKTNDAKNINKQKDAENEAKAEKIYAIGLRYYEQAQYKEALSTFNNVSEILPHYKDTDRYIILTKAQIAKQVAVEQSSKKDFLESMKQVRAYDLYARGLYDKQYGRYQEAAEKFQEVLRLDPVHQGARQNLIELRLSEEKEKREIEERIIGLVQGSKGKQIEMLYVQAQELLKNNRPEEGIVKLEKILELEPENKETKELLTHIKLMQKVAERDEKGAPYELGPGDVVDINVLNHAELSGPVTVEPGGELILPLLQEVIQADGLTKEELESKCKEQLVKYIKDPEVRIVIKEYNSNKWYILGQVGLRGEYPLGKTRLTLMEALYQAGLPLENVSAIGRVLVIKPRKGNPYIRSINVAQILYKGDLTDNVYIERRDIIYVPQTVLNKVTTVASQIAAPIGAIRASSEDIIKISDNIKTMTPLSELLGVKKKKGVPLAY